MFQYVIRPDLDFRGYAGQVASGVVKPGDPVMVLPSGRTSRVKSIVTYDGNLPRAFPPMSVTLCLEDEIDISRGDMLVPPSHPPHAARRIDARWVWMHEQNLEIGRQYLLKHTSQTVRATVDTLRYRININTLEKEAGAVLGLNDIGAVVIETQKPVFCDPYRRNHATGSFVLIDPMTNATVAAGMITGRDPGTRASNPDPAKASPVRQRVTRADQESRAGHRVLAIWMETPPEVAHQLECLLFDANCRVHALSAPGHESYLPELTRTLNSAGVMTLIYGSTDAHLRERVAELAGEHCFLHIEQAMPVEAIYRLLQDEGIISRFSQGD
jgi:hypothetical protein